MSADISQKATQLLISWSGGDGDRDALDQLIPFVYNELRRLAGGYLRGERPGHTLQPTALANEVYLRLIDQNQVRWQDRAHFFALAGRMMRRVLVDHARRHRAKKRGGTATRVVFDEAFDRPAGADADVSELIEAFKALEEMDPRQAEIVELRFFGGLSVEEIAQVMGISTGTVKREWRTAKAWFFKELTK